MEQLEERNSTASKCLCGKIVEQWRHTTRTHRYKSYLGKLWHVLYIDSMHEVNIKLHCLLSNFKTVFVISAFYTRGHCALVLLKH